MMDESREELAALYAVGALDPAEAGAFEAQMGEDPELEALVRQFQDATAALAHGAPPVEPSGRVLLNLLGTIRSEKASATLPAPAQESAIGWLPWSLAAAFAVMAVVFGAERFNLKKEVAVWRDRDALSTLQIATLTSQLEGAPGSVGAIAWDDASQRGVITLAKMPVPDPKQDYQLWVIDPKYPDPVDGGVVAVDQDGKGWSIFGVKRRISSAQKFAISRERKGGVPKAEGPIVMLSE